MLTEATSPDRNLAMELVRATEAGALAASRWRGHGDKLAADGAAVHFMRHVLATVEMDGIVVIGEGEKDEAPMLANGELVGTGKGPKTDIAVDPLDGTTQTSIGGRNAVAVLAVSERDTMYNPGPFVYMEKIAVGPELVDVPGLGEDDLEVVLPLIAKKLDRPLRRVNVAILDRPRHRDTIERLRHIGVKVQLFPDGDVAMALATALPESGVDVMVGIGGTPEGVLAAAGLKCAGGAIIGKAVPREGTDELERGLALGMDPDELLTTDRLVGGDNCFFALTGVTDGELVRGVHFEGRFITTESVVMRSSSGTFRRVPSRHRIDKIEALGIDV